MLLGLPVIFVMFFMETESLQQDILTKKARYRAWGRFLVFAPTIGLLLSIVAFICATVVVGRGDMFVFARIVRVLGGLLGTISMLGFMFGVPIGIVLLGISNRLFAGASDPRSAQGSVAPVPSEIRGWNWGAAGLGWLWGVSHNVWISLMSFVPVVGIFMWIILGIKGNEWAWQSAPWQSVEQFKAAQDKWKIWGILIVVMYGVAMVIAMALFGIFGLFMSA
jgi:hypothetical protein